MNDNKNSIEPKEDDKKNRSNLRLPKNPDIVDKKEIENLLYDMFNLTHVQCNQAINAIIDHIKSSILKKKVVKFIGFGKFSLVVRKGRKARNPLNGEPVIVEKHYAVKFFPSPEMKNEAVNVNKKNKKLPKKNQDDSGIYLTEISASELDKMGPYHVPVEKISIPDLCSTEVMYENKV